MTPEIKCERGVIILGAGASSRMGAPKLLLPWHDTTVIGHLLRQWRELGVAQVAMVIRAGDRALLAELERLEFSQLDCIFNPQPERGMFSSILCAASWSGWRSNLSNWAIVLGDQPHLRTESLRRLLNFSAQNPEAICQPSFGGYLGHPVMLPGTAFEDLRSTPAATLKDYLTRTGVSRIHCPVDDPGLPLDMDTPEDYNRLTS